MHRAVHQSTRRRTVVPRFVFLGLPVILDAFGFPHLFLLFCTRFLCSSTCTSNSICHLHLLFCDHLKIFLYFWSHATQLKTGLFLAMINEFHLNVSNQFHFLRNIFWLTCTPHINVTMYPFLFLLLCFTLTVNNNNCILFPFSASNYVGFGLMDAHGLVCLAKTWTTVPSQLKCIVSHPQTNRFVWVELE